MNRAAGKNMVGRANKLVVTANPTQGVGGTLDMVDSSCAIHEPATIFSGPPVLQGDLIEVSENVVVAVMFQNIIKPGFGLMFLPSTSLRVINFECILCLWFTILQSENLSAHSVCVRSCQY